MAHEDMLAITQLVDLAAMAANARDTARVGALWSLSAPELNLNLVRFPAGDGVPAHVNNEVDVVVVVVSGEGVAEIDGREERLRSGVLLFIPKGVTRAFHATSGDLAYLTCHRRRARLMPHRVQRGSAVLSPGESGS